MCFLLSVCNRQRRHSIFPHPAVKGNRPWTGFLPRFLLKTLLGVSGSHDVPFTREEVAWPCRLNVLGPRTGRRGSALVPVPVGCAGMRSDHHGEWQPASACQEEMCHVKLIYFFGKARGLEVRGAKEEVACFDLVVC